MTYFPKTGIYSSDSPSIDAFGRFRQSTPFTLFDSKLLFSSSSLLWDSSGSDGGFFEYSQSEACVYLKTTATANSRAVRQTKEWFNYQPGKSQAVVSTGILHPEAGVIKRIGYFEDNNGLFFESSGSDIYVVIRNQTIDTKVSQSAWNIDTMDGHGESEIAKDWSKAHIFLIDFEWLGVGRVRFGSYHNGTAYYVHEAGHGNSLTSVYMQTPNLPLRYEILNVAGSAVSEMKQICSSVTSEGGLDPNGVGRSLSSPSTGRAISQDVTGSLVAIRLKDNCKGAHVIISFIDIVTVTAGSTNYWLLALNPSGSSGFTWQDISESPLQEATNVGSVNIKVEAAYTGSVIFDSGYFFATTGMRPNAGASVDNLLRLGSKIDGTKDVIVLAACPLAGGAATYYGTVRVKEI